MKFTIGLVIITAIIEIIIISLTSVKHVLYTQLAWKSVSSALLFLGLILLQRFSHSILKLEINNKMNVDEGINIFNSKSLAVLSATLVLALIVLNIFPKFIQQYAIEALYLIVLVASGSAFTLSCRSPWHVPVLSAAVVLIIVSCINSLSFYLDPIINSQYGPKVLEYALVNQSKFFTKLPGSIIAAWAGWRLTFDIINIREIKASSAVSK